MVTVFVVAGFFVTEQGCRDNGGIVGIHRQRLDPRCGGIRVGICGVDPVHVRQENGVGHPRGRAQQFHDHITTQNSCPVTSVQARIPVQDRNQTRGDGRLHGLLQQKNAVVVVVGVKIGDGGDSS